VKHFFKNLILRISPFWDYLKHWWLFLVIVTALIGSNAWMWTKVIPETKITINLDSIFTIFFTGALVYFAWRQHHLEKTNQKIALYPKRLLVFETLMDTISSISFQPDKLPKDIDKVIPNILSGKFLFSNDKNVINYLEQFILQVSDFVFSFTHEEKSRIEFKTAPTQDNNEKWQKEKLNRENVANWFKDESNSPEKMFEKYLWIQG